MAMDGRRGGGGANTGTVFSTSLALATEIAAGDTNERMCSGFPRNRTFTRLLPACSLVQDEEDDMYMYQSVKQN